MFWTATRTPDARTTTRPHPTPVRTAKIHVARWWHLSAVGGGIFDTKSLAQTSDAIAFAPCRACKITFFFDERSKRLLNRELLGKACAPEMPDPDVGVDSGAFSHRKYGR